jgi:hypothetical protein
MWATHTESVDHFSIHLKSAMAEPTAVGSQDPDQEILIWTKLQVPKDLELDIEWDGLFLPLIRAPGHVGSGWTRLQNPDTILLVTGELWIKCVKLFKLIGFQEWERTLNQREFIASPSAQLYHENLKSQGIIHVSSNETFSSRFHYLDALLNSYVQLFWVYFAVPVTETQKAQLLKIKPIRGPAMLKNFLSNYDRSPEYNYPIKMWATHTESVDGQEAQLMLWPHFWKNAERAEHRHFGKFARSGNPIVGGRTLQDIFCEKLEKVGPISWTEEFVSFKTITDQ